MSAQKPHLVIGAGHLAHRIRNLAGTRGRGVIQCCHADLRAKDAEASPFDAITGALRLMDLSAVSTVYLVDDRDEYNLELLIALISLNKSLPIVASLYNENIAPHLQAANPNVRILNPAKLAAPAFVDALTTPLAHSLRYVPARIPPEPKSPHSDNLITRLVSAFAVVLTVAVVYFHFAEKLSWLNSAYFVIVTVATVGYGDITLLNAGAMSKLAGIALILSSTAFIWMIFSLTVDTIIKRRVQLSLGRRNYPGKGHVILCGLGRLGYFVGEGLLAKGERLLIVEKNEDSLNVDHFRRLGADVYIGDARIPRVLQDAGVTRAKALYSVIDNDFANLEVGLNARSFDPKLRLILRIFDESMSHRVRENLDIHLTFSTSALVDDRFYSALKPVLAPNPETNHETNHET